MIQQKKKKKNVHPDTVSVTVDCSFFASTSLHLPYFPNKEVKEREREKDRTQKHTDTSEDENDWMN